MFVMMNAARLQVGVQGVGIAERAYQQALAFSLERKQGRSAWTGTSPSRLFDHPDVRRTLMLMKAKIEAARGICLSTAVAADLARHAANPVDREAARMREDLLTPIAKAWSTDMGVEVASIALQVHGGMGFIEETGVAQTLRDVRITSIYEGTTGIQANDLVGRKLGRDRGAAMTALLGDTLRELNDLKAGDAVMRSVRNATIEAITMLRDATEALRAQVAETPARAYAVSVPYLHLCGRVLGGAMMARSAAIASARLAAVAGDEKFYRAKLQTARFYAEHLLPQSLGLLRIIKSGGASVADADPELL
jgi:hypothetical protein